MGSAKVIIGTMLLCTSGGVLAAQASPDAAPAPAAKAVPPGERIVCREETETGSLTARKRICMTVSQWKDQAFRSGQWIEHQSTYNSQPNGR